MRVKTYDIIDFRSAMESISPTFYEQLLQAQQAQIPKAEKNTDDLTFFLHFKVLLRLSSVDEIDPKHVDEIEPCILLNFLKLYLTH